MEPDKQLLKAWQKGVALGHAWWAFADTENKKRFRELQRKGGGSHLGLQRSLEIDLAARISASELKALGIEHGSDAGPIFIPQYYFSKTAEIDWDKEIVAALGKKFYEVRIHEESKLTEIDEPVESGPLDPQPTQGERGPLTETFPSDPAPSTKPPVDEELESADESSQSEPEPAGEPHIQSTDETPPSEPAAEKLEDGSLPLKVGRPSKGPEIEQAIEILLGRGVDLARMKRPKAYAAVKECAASELNSNIKIGFHNSVIQRFLFRRFGARR
jgi:hypothetical protein